MPKLNLVIDESLLRISLFKLISLILFLLVAFESLAQESKYSQIGYTPQIPASPEAASLGKYGEYEMNLSNGTPSVSVPFFTISSGSIKVPISISYDASGNRVNDEGSWIGLGWSLNIGGVITRSVRGVADEKPPANYINDSEWFKDGITIADYSKLQSAAAELLDTEPDLYSFNFDGYSGTFVIDNAGDTPSGPSLPS